MRLIAAEAGPHALTRDELDAIVHNPWTTTVLVGRHPGDGSPLGFITYTTFPALTIQVLAVHPDHRRQGHATHLLVKALLDAIDKRSLTVYAVCSERADAGIAFLSARGFLAMRSPIPRAYPDGADALFWKCDLTKGQPLW